MIDWDSAATTAPGLIVSSSENGNLRAKTPESHKVHIKRHLISRLGLTRL